NENATLFAGNDTTICEGNTINLAPEIINPAGMCEYDLSLTDTWGDGWNGNTVSITIAGQTTDYTITTGSAADFTFSAPNGANVQFSFNANGAFVNECVYSLTDENGTVVTSGGPNLAGAQIVNFTSDCAPDYVFDWQSAANLSDGTIQNPVWTPVTSETLNLSIHPIGHPLCVSTDDIAVTVIAPPYAGVDSTAEFCSLA